MEKYKPEYVEQVYKLCLLGAIDTELADFFGVCESSLNVWKNKYPEFYESMKKGKLIADAQVAGKLFERANGYNYDEVQVKGAKLTDDDSEEEAVIEEQITTTTKHIAPDVTAIRYWLNNRTKGKWKDRNEQKITIDLSGKTDAELEAIIASSK